MTIETLKSVYYIVANDNISELKKRAAVAAVTAALLDIESNHSELLLEPSTTPGGWQASLREQVIRRRGSLR